MLQATWTDSSGDSDDWHHYDFQLEDMTTNKLSTFQTQDAEFQIAVVSNRSYGVTVRSVDFSGNNTPWATQVVHTSTKDATAPDAPTNLSATGTFTNIILTWSHGAESDLSHFVVYRHTSNASGSASQIGAAVKEFSGSLAMFIDTPPDDSTYYYWIKAVDESGNESDFSVVDSDNAPGVETGVGPGTITATEIADNAVTTPKLIANAVTAAKITAGAVETDKLAALAVTAAKIAAGAITTVKLDADAVTAAKIAAGVIDTEHMAADSITADEIDVSTLSAIAANIGTVTAGVARSSDSNFYIDFTNKYLKIFGENITIEEDANDELDWTEDSTTYNATLTASTTYTPASLCTHIQAQMRTEGDNNTTVTYSPTTRKITIANSTLTTLSLLWSSGANTDLSCGRALGFDVTADDTGALTYTGDRECTLRVILGDLS
ncbi:MAG: hypothetical protein DRQ43_11335 [Gammaproteobacteria bacterium]|nr:MAG: hypothetical protein DRQ43_11335 [Gammaproteobacteria bacterium]